MACLSLNLPIRYKSAGKIGHGRNPADGTDVGDEQQPIDKLLVVIHGVGDPEPGETVSLLARSLADLSAPLEERHETLWLTERSPEADDPRVLTFASHVRRLRVGKARVEMAEVFWGDLSRVRKGFIGTISGVFRILFGLRYVAFVASDQASRSAAAVQQLGLLSSRILHGPVLAVTFYLAILAVALLATQLMWPESYRSQFWTQVVLSGCCAVALLLSQVGSRVTHSRVVGRFWFWVNVTAVFVAGIMMLKPMVMSGSTEEHLLSVRPGLIWYCRVLVVLLGMLWLIEMAVLAAMAICWLWALRDPRNFRPALHVAVLLPAFAVGTWGHLLPMTWLAARKWIHWLASLPDFAGIFSEAVPLLGVQFLMLIVILAANLLVVIRYVRWRSRVTVHNYLHAGSPPRLIVHGFLQAVIGGCTVVGATTILTIGWMQQLGYQNHEFLLGNLLSESNKYAVAILTPMAGLLFFVMPHLRSGFDIVLDVVNHFYFRSTRVQDTVDDGEEFDIAETTFQSGRLFYARRDTIHGRLKRILRHYREATGGSTELVLVAHSQGTMIAIEVLNDPELAWLRNRFTRISLITMGSPMTNLYQYYFRHLYPSLHRPYWSELRKRVDRWLNIYRIDDYVGREIEFPDPGELGEPEVANGCEKWTPPVYQNRVVGPRGHQGYWTDREVVDLLKQELAVPASPRIARAA